MYQLTGRVKRQFQSAVTSRIIRVGRTVWFQCNVSASTLFCEAFSCLFRPTRLSFEVNVVPSGDVVRCFKNASHLTISQLGRCSHGFFYTALRSNLDCLLRKQGEDSPSSCSALSKTKQLSVYLRASHKKQA